MKKLLMFSLLALLLISCIEYREKMKLNSDGSGEITFAIGVSESLFNMGTQSEELKNFDENKIKENYTSKKGIKFLGSKTYSQDGNKFIEVKLAFESLQLLMESSKDSAQQSLIGGMSLTEDANGNIVFTRKISKGDKSVQNDSTSDAMGNGMMEMMFGQYKWKYELTVPGKIISTNAVSNDIDNSANTIKWTMSMASLSKPQMMTVTYEKSAKLSLTLIILGCIFIILLASALYFSITKKKKAE